MAIFNKYKNILDNFINIVNLESLPELINTSSSNMSRFRDGSTSFLEKNELNGDILALNRSSKLVPELKTPSCISTMMLQFLVCKVRQYNIKRVRR